MDKAVSNIVETALDAGRQLAPKVISNPIMDGVPFVVLRNSDGAEHIQHLAERNEAPARKKGIVKLFDEASFIEYWARHKSKDSTIYGSMDPAKFLAVFDDHSTEKPNYKEHRADYSLEHSGEYEAWDEKNRKPFNSNEELARWLEDQLIDIVKPDGARMLEIALNFRVNQSAAFSNAIRLTDGNTEFTYTDDVEGSSRVANKKVSIPEEFDIEIPIWAGLNVSKYRFTARFRYRLAAGRLSLWYELVRPHKVVEKAYGDLLTSIEKSTKVKVMFGTPE